MNTHLPSIESVRAALTSLSLAQIGALSTLSGVPFTTLYKIKLGTTTNPGIETVGKFIHLISEVSTPTERAGA